MDENKQKPMRRASEVLGTEKTPLFKDKKVKKTRKKRNTRSLSSVNKLAPETVVSVEVDPTEVSSAVDIDISIPPQETVTPTPTMISASKVADSGLDDLIDAILGLTDTLRKDKIDALKETKKEEIKEKQKDTSVLDILKTAAKDKVGEVKERLTMRNLLTSAGVRSAQGGSGGIVDTLLTYREQKKIEKAEEQRPTALGAIASGSADYLKGKFANAVGAIGETRAGTTAKSLMNSVSGAASNAYKKATAPIDFGIERKIKAAGIMSGDTLMGAISRRMYPEIGADPEIAMSDLLTKKPKTPEQREFQEGVRSGMKDELLEMNKEQLEQLKKLVAAATKEESLEDKLEARQQKAHPVVVEKEKKKEEEKTESLLNSIMDKIPGIKGIIGKGAGLLASGAAAAGKLALPALAVGGAAAGGYMVGDQLNKHIINPGMEKITGVEGETLGTAIYTLVDNIKGFFGKSDADKLKLNSPVSASVSDRLAPVQNSISKQEVEPIKHSVAMTENVKNADAYRKTQVDMIKSTMQEIDVAKSSTPKQAGNVVDARTSVVNNTNTTQYVRPSIRHVEPTFNSLLSRHFSR